MECRIWDSICWKPCETELPDTDGLVVTISYPCTGYDCDRQGRFRYNRFCFDHKTARKRAEVDTGSKLHYRLLNVRHIEATLGRECENPTNYHLQSLLKPDLRRVQF